MQLSSILLYATALLAQATSGFYLSSPRERVDFERVKEQDPIAYAKLSTFIDDVTAYARISKAHGEVVFAHHLTDLANITIDAQGDIEKSGFAFVQVESAGSIYQLMNVSSTPDDLPKITKPFAVEDGKFVYKGYAAIHPPWVLKHNGEGWGIHLRVAPIQGPHDDDGGIVNGDPLPFSATLLVHES